MNINCLSENGFNCVNNDFMNAYRKAAALSTKKGAMEMCRCHGTYTCEMCRCHGTYTCEMCVAVTGPTRVKCV